MNKQVLNVGAGAIDWENPRYEANSTVTHLDGCYRESALSAVDVENAMISQDGTHHYVSATNGSGHILCSSDIFEFIERFPFKFDQVYAERIFEHMEYVGGEIGRLLEGLNRITNDDATLTIVVPNMILVSGMLLEYENSADTMSIADQLNTKLIINSEMQNIRSDPHVSTWTPRLATEYINSEGTWEVIDIEHQIEFAHRDIYMRIECAKQNINNK
jgi:hypothetical protein